MNKIRMGLLVGVMAILGTTAVTLAGPVQSSRVAAAHRRAEGPRVSGLRHPIHRPKVRHTATGLASHPRPQR